MTRITASNTNLQTANTSFYVMGSVHTFTGAKNARSNCRTNQ